jgi:hypothetical protein
MQTDPRKACANQEEKLLWALVHDGIAHPLMALTLFSDWAVAFHDWTSKKAWPRKTASVPIVLINFGQNKDKAFATADKLRHADIAHCVSSTPQGGNIFHYTVEILS